MMWLEEIRETGFDQENLWSNKKEVIEYFTVENIKSMMSNECAWKQDELDAMRDEVLSEWYWMQPNTKTRVEAIQSEAMRMVEASGIPLDISLDPYMVRETLVKILASKMKCHQETAKRHIYKAIRRQRHPEWKPAKRGGPRPGSGRPRTYKLDSSEN